MSDLRVLSIQSHVVFGYVGNKSATFPLQLHGFDVDGINSVQLSNHTGYKVFKGQILNENDLDNLIEGLSENKLDCKYSHLLTGYVRNDKFLLGIVNIVKQLREKRPNLIYVCDPVLGDCGKLYVPKELVNIFQNQIIPLADIITPNQTELEFLSGMKADTMENALKCIKFLHEKNCKMIVVTSLEFCDESEQLYVIASCISNEKFFIQIPKLRGKFFGTGDLFAALFLAWFTKTNDVATTLEKTVSTVHAVITRTLNSFKYCSGDNNEQLNLELKLIQSKDDIENPKIFFKSKKL
ncbi:hypothetical protein PGB90_002488 [Kerria lacca]